jgi:hypothetical protein
MVAGTRPCDVTRDIAWRRPIQSLRSAAVSIPVSFLRLKRPLSTSSSHHPRLEGSREGGWLRPPPNLGRQLQRVFNDIETDHFRLGYLALAFQGKAQHGACSTNNATSRFWSTPHPYIVDDYNLYSKFRAHHAVCLQIKRISPKSIFTVDSPTWIIRHPKQHNNDNNNKNGGSNNNKW